MKKMKSIGGPRYPELILPTYKALLALGGSGKNDEIHSMIIEQLKLTDIIVDEPHLGSTNQSELQYQLAWARTYLKNYGVIENSARSVWSITSEFNDQTELNVKDIIAFTSNKNSMSRKIGLEQAKEISIGIQNIEDSLEKSNYSLPEEIRPWKLKLMDVLQNMDPYAFERLSQRLLRECGFTQVSVTKKSNDGGIDGTGKLKINGIFSFNVAFQCKRYKSAVGASEIRDFRGSLTTDIEKGVFITTSTFTKAAKEEASNTGKQQIDLISGEEFIAKLAEYEIGVKEIKDYEIDDAFFQNI